MHQYEILGINSDSETCDICGKTHLKKVVWLRDVEEGKPFSAGTTCAARLMGQKATKSTYDDMWQKAKVISKVISMLGNNEIPLPLRANEWREARSSRREQLETVKKANELLDKVFNHVSFGWFTRVTMEYRMIRIDDIIISPKGEIIKDFMLERLRS